MPTPRMTETEKRRRGTFQPCRATKPRSIADIDASILEVNELIEALKFVMQQAKSNLKKDGISIPAARGGQRLNPNVRLLLTLPGKLRDARRELVLLADERELAAVKEREASEPDEFAGL